MNHESLQGKPSGPPPEEIAIEDIGPSAIIDPRFNDPDSVVMRPAPSAEQRQRENTPATQADLDRVIARLARFEEAFAKLLRHLQPRRARR